MQLDHHPAQRPQRHNAAWRAAACWRREHKRDQRRARGREPKDQSRKPHQYFLRGPAGGGPKR